MNSNYVAEIQPTCIPNEQIVAGQHVAVNIYVDGNMLLVRATRCPGVNAALHLSIILVTTRPCKV